MSNENEYMKLLGKAGDAKRGGRDSWRVMSTGEKLAVALVLNRPEWLTEMDYTLAEAIDRAGPVWVSLIPKVARDLKDEDAE
jgi:hypothetical protein